MMRSLKLAAIAAGVLVVLGVAGVFGASAYYSSERGQGCASCHEMSSYVSHVHDSPHRTMNCMECHEAGLATKLRHTWVHLTRTWPESIRLREVDVPTMSNCRKSGRVRMAGRSAQRQTMRRYLPHPRGNFAAPLDEAALHCPRHLLGGSTSRPRVGESPIGPWRLVHAGPNSPRCPARRATGFIVKAHLRQGRAERISVAGAASGLFRLPSTTGAKDCTLLRPASALRLRRRPRALNVSPDPRQGVCYQCHAPRVPDAGSVAAANSWGTQAGSGDDRTPMGVHEGLSCFSCHNGHNESARASCKTCHPQMSHCGLDVEKMDTTFASATSMHNIHWVKCTDCHQHGIPKKKTASPTHAESRLPSGSNG